MAIPGFPVPHPQQRALTDAFEIFTQASEQLVAEYRVLERRVTRLTSELAAARFDRVKQLAEQERLAGRLRHVLEALPAGVVVLDAVERVQECNASAETLLGIPLIGERWQTVMQRAACDWRGGTECRLTSGRHIEFYSRPMEPESGQILLIQDVTEVRALREHLHRNQRLSMMGEMVARLAHQLRTPLASALLYVSHLHRAELSQPERLRYAEKVAGRLHHLEHLVNDMLSFARGAESDMNVVSLEELLHELVQTVEPPLRERRGSITVEPLATDLSLCAQREGLLGALLNICTNAWEAAGDGVHIHVEVTAADPQHVEFRVSDNGPGISAHVQERIFEPFYTTRRGGTGLGLAVVRAVVEGHGGEVYVRSREGAGSMFVIRLPRDGSGQDALPSGAQSWAVSENARLQFGSVPGAVGVGMEHS